MNMTKNEILKEVFRLSMNLPALPVEYSFGILQESDGIKTITVEHFNDKLPSDFFILTLDKYNNVFIDANYFHPDGDNSFICQPIYNQCKLQKFLENYTPAVTMIDILQDRI